MKTIRNIKYVGAMRYRTLIPAGTKVIPASNLPAPENEGFWAEPWESMSEIDESWMRNYGFYIDSHDVHLGD